MSKLDETTANEELVTSYGGALQEYNIPVKLSLKTFKHIILKKFS